MVASFSFPFFFSPGRGVSKGGGALLALSDIPRPQRETTLSLGSLVLEDPALTRGIHPVGRKMLARRAARVAAVGRLMELAATGVDLLFANGRDVRIFITRISAIPGVFRSPRCFMKPSRSGSDGFFLFSKKEFFNIKLTWFLFCARVIRSSFYNRNYNKN